MASRPRGWIARKAALQMPSWATVVVSAVLTALVAVNATVLHLGPPWSEGLTLSIALLGLYGVTVLTHGMFQALVAVPPQVMAVIGIVLAGLQLLVRQSGVGLTARTILECVIVAAAALGFEPTVIGGQR